MCMSVMRVWSMLVTMFTLFVCMFVAVLSNDISIMWMIMMAIIVAVPVLMHLLSVDMFMLMFFSDSQVSTNYHKA